MKKSVLVALAVDGVYHVRNHLLDTHSKEGEILTRVSNSEKALQKLTPLVEDTLSKVENTLSKVENTLSKVEDTPIKLDSLTAELAKANERIAALDTRLFNEQLQNILNNSGNFTESIILRETDQTVLESILNDEAGITTHLIDCEILPVEVLNVLTSL